MAKIDKKIISETIQELYLYPYRSKGENLIRSSVWLASWWFGVRGQESVSGHALGCAYFVLASSLLLEFYSEQKTLPIPRFMHGFFCCFLFIMGSFSFILATSSPSPEQAVPEWYDRMNTVLCAAGPLFCLIVILNILFIGFDTHKFFYDREAELKREQEVSLKAAQDQFTANLEGPKEGGHMQ